MNLPWISVEERLPPNDGANVLAWAGGGFIDAWFQEGTWEDYEGDPLFGRVTHWLEVTPPITLEEGRKNAEAS